MNITPAAYTLHQRPPSITTIYTTTDLFAPFTTTFPFPSDPNTAADPTTTTFSTNPYSPPPSQPQQCPSQIRYQFAVAILSTGIAIAIVVLAIIFLYLKPKRWTKKGAASRDAEMEALHKANEAVKGELRDAHAAHAAGGSGGYARFAGARGPTEYVAVMPGHGLW